MDFRLPPLLLPAALLLLAVPSRGQDAAASRVDTLDTLSPLRHQDATQKATLAVGHPDLGEINLVNRQEAPKWFSFQTNQLLSYSSNAFLTRDEDRGSFLWNGRLAGSVVPYATRDFTPSISFEQNFFRYQRFSQLDFDTQTLSLNLKYDLTRDDRWTTNSSVAITRLYTSRFDSGDFYKYATFSESLTYVHQLGKLPIYTGTTLGGALRVGDPSVFDRWSIFLNSAAIYSPITNIQLAVFVRPELQLYTNQDGGPPLYGASAVGREKHPSDFALSAGASVTWTPCKEFSLGANFLWTENWSTFGPHEYSVLAPNVSLSGSYAF